MTCAAKGEARAVIVSGGRLGGWALEYIHPDDFVIGADSGADFLVRSGVRIDLAIGDFDSVPPQRLGAILSAAGESRAVDAVEKDWTDTEMAMREAIRRGYREILLLGGLGTRFDHSLANVHLLHQALIHQCEARLIDEHNEIRLCAGECRIQADARYPYISLLPLTPKVTGISLTGFRYPLSDAELILGYSLGISNVLESEAGTITVREGMLLVIRSRD
jgi:thiamine pyrophosphokinase